LRNTGGPAGSTEAGFGNAAAAAGGLAGSSSAASFGSMRHASSDMGLGSMPDAGAAAAAAGGLGGAGSSSASLSGSRAGSMAYLAGEDASGLPELPASQIVKLSCDYFCRPMLEPMVSWAA
jgi:hypothetical protein